MVAHPAPVSAQPWLDRLREALPGAAGVEIQARVNEVVGTVVRSTLPDARIGEMCLLQTPGEARVLEAEVVAFTDGQAILSPLGSLDGVSSSTAVVATGKAHQIAVGDWLRGMVLDGLGRPLTGAIPAHAQWQVVGSDPPQPLTRRMIDKPLCTGVRAIDGLLTCAEGQRIGIFAAAGGGKSTLLGMLAKGADVDITVIALVGERGREVREFIEHELGPEGMARAVVVCATSDRPAMERAKAAHVATAIAEHFRDQGLRVLLLMDSVTRFGRALREIGLAVGEPPARRGFPPSVFAALPRLMERAGMGPQGSITAFYTVLVEGDDMNEPVADETRSILDGHIILSRKLAAAYHYPAIDILASVSRVMNAVVQQQHRQAAGRLRELLAKYDETELLLKLGEYKSGSDALVDAAIERMPGIRGFLRQGASERVAFADTVAQMGGLAR